MGWQNAGSWQSHGWGKAAAGGGGGSNVALDASGESTFSNLFGSTTNNYTNITAGATAASNGVLIVFVEAGVGSITDITSVKWDSAGTNQTMTLVDSVALNNGFGAGFAVSAVYKLLNPTAGNKTLTVTTTNGSENVIACGASFDNCTTITSSKTPTAVNTANTLSLSVSSAASHMTYGVGRVGNGSAGDITMSSPTDASGAYFNAGNMRLRSAVSAGAATVTYTANTDGPNDYISILAVDLAP